MYSLINSYIANSVVGCQGRMSFIFMQFSAKKLQNNRLAHPFWELAPPPFEKILDPPLQLHLTPCYLSSQDLVWVLVWNEDAKFATKLKRKVTLTSQAVDR